MPSLPYGWASTIATGTAARPSGTTTRAARPRRKYAVAEAHRVSSASTPISTGAAQSAVV